MTRIESNSVTVEASTDSVFDYLTDLRNYEPLMPEQVSGFKSDEKSASFNLKGLGDMIVTIVKEDRPSKIQLEPSGKLPFRFNLFWELSQHDEKATVQAVAEADLNMFMKMMAEPRLKEFVNAMADSLRNAGIVD